MNRSGFVSINAELNRLVRRQEEILVELPDRNMREDLLVKNVPKNFKIKLTDKEAPLKLLLNYPASDQNKVVLVYTSFLNKEPSEENNTGKFINPNVITISG
jgi:hypothetical protein